MRDKLSKFKEFKTTIILTVLLSATFWMSGRDSLVLNYPNATDVYAASRDYISTATNSKVTLNASTFTKISDANSKRSYFVVSNTAGIAKVYINLSTVDNGVDETGIYLKSGESWSMPCTAIYTGEICAIATTDAPDVSICEY